MDRDSVCYCIGAGEDISFDTELKIIYDVYILDPMPEGRNYFLKLKEYAANGKILTIDEANDFIYRISMDQLDQIQYIETGVWDQNTILKFYSPCLEDFASHSVYLFKDSKEYIEAPLDRLNNLIRKSGHSRIDLVKMEIE